MSFNINTEQIADLVERALVDLEERKIKKQCSFPEAAQLEIEALHARLSANLKLAVSVFLTRSVEEARRLLEEKRCFREIERACAERHLARLADPSGAGAETSSLHLDLMRELRRINSHICAVAEPLLEPVAHQVRERDEPSPGGVDDLRTATPH